MDAEEAAKWPGAIGDWKARALAAESIIRRVREEMEWEDEHEIPDGENTQETIREWLKVHEEREPISRKLVEDIQAYPALSDLE